MKQIIPKKKTVTKSKKFSPGTCDMTFEWSLTIGPRWQVVIPKAVRERLSLTEWDQMMIIIKNNMAIGLVKTEDRGQMMEYLRNEEVSLAA